MDDKEKRHLFDDPRNVRWVVRGVVIACVISVVVQLFVHVHAEHPAESFFAFNGIYGFIAFVVLVFLAKEGLRRAVMRKEDYYDE